MKKFIYSALAAIGLLLSPSCSDENEALSGSGNEALVSFSVNLADGISTKAISDGTKATNLVVDVFEKNTSGEYIQIDGLRHMKDGEFKNGSLSTKVDFNLVKGKTYRLIFWAQKQSVVNPTNSPYGISNLSTITVDYTAGITDDEDRDAFLAVTEDITVSGNFTKSIKMTRPFAQLNYLIDEAEYTAAKKAGMNIQKAKVTVAKVATQLNPLENSVSGPVNDVIFEVNAFPTNFGAADLEGENHLVLPKAGVTQDPANSTNENYYYLASKYFLVYAGDGAAEKAGAPATLATTSLKLVDGSDQEIANYEFKLPAVPVQCNHRTNIYGNLITSKGTFNVTIDPIFNEELNPDINLPQYAAVVDSPEEISEEIAGGATTIIASESFQLSNNSTTPTTITVPKIYNGLKNGVELTFDLSKATVTSGTAEITITEGTSETDTQKLPENVNVIASGNITINLPTSHVTLNGNEISGSGTYNTVTASTSDNTLVVPNGVIVETLIVKAGKVRIEKGGKVGTITRDAKNEDDKTIVFLEDGGELDINAITDPKIIVVQQSIISNAAELRAFAEAVNKGYTYEGETVVLSDDIDLKNADWTPIGANADAEGYNFKGTFDGQNHTIRNLKVNQDEGYHAAGLFGSLIGTAKNFTIEGAEITNLSTGDPTTNGTAVVAGSLYSAAEGFNGTIENVTVKNVKVRANRYVAGIAGYVYGSIKNCHVENAELISTPDNQSGNYDNGDKAGGIAGTIYVP